MQLGETGADQKTEAFSVASLHFIKGISRGGKSKPVK